MTRPAKYPICETPIGGEFVVRRATELHRIAVLTGARLKGIKVTTRKRSGVMTVRRVA